MQFIQIENTNLNVSRLGFGTASLHHLYRKSQRLRLLDAAFSVGITHFDTSPYYGYGLAESDLRLLIRRRRDAVTVATKVGLYAPGGAVHGSLAVWLRKAAGKFYRGLSLPVVNWNIRMAERSLNASLKRLGTDYVDILFLHEPDPILIDSEGFLTWLESERAKGKIRYWGLAGMPHLLEGWVSEGHPLATIIQAKDSLDRKEADLLLSKGRRLQFTYGYLSSASRGATTEPADMILSKALKRNTDGIILISTCRLEHIEQLARVVS